MTPAYRKSWAGNLLMLSDLPWPLPQGQMMSAKIKSAYNSLVIVPEVCNVKPA